MEGKLTLYHFKNYETFVFPLSQRTVITGRNGVGKTNLLEAVYLAINAAYPPFRQGRDMVRNRQGE